MENIYTIRKNKKRSLKRLLLLALFLCIIAVMPVIYGPFFKVDKIQIEGNKNISVAAIQNTVESFYGENLLMIKKEAIKNAVTGSLPIQSVTISYKLPRTLIVTVKEREVAAALPYLNSFVLIDTDGIIVKIVSKLENISIPIVTGFKVVNAQVAKLPVLETNKKAYDDLLKLLKVIPDVSSELSELNVSGEEKTKYNLYTLDGYQIALGEVTEQKIDIMMAILDDLRKNNRGKGLVDLTNETPFFQQFEGDWEGED